MLDLACGAGRHALWFAEHGWDVTAIDGSTAAIDSLRAQASTGHWAIDTRVADLEKHEFAIEPSAWDLILIWLYLQPDLFEIAKAGVRPGGILIASVRLKMEGEEAKPHRAHPGELKDYFRDWEILDYAEGVSSQPGGEHSIAQIAVRRPALTAL